MNSRACVECARFNRFTWLDDDGTCRRASEHGMTAAERLAARDAGLGVGHIWTAVSCPAYRTLRGADCTCKTMNATQETYTYWVCVDCYHAANGLDERERGEAYPAGTLSLLPDTADVTAGLMAAEHAADCPVFPVIDDDGTRGEFDGSQECECETNSFSSSRCDGCDSALAGERFALTVWTETN